MAITPPSPEFFSMPPQNSKPTICPLECPKSTPFSANADCLNRHGPATPVWIGSPAQRCGIIGRNGLGHRHIEKLRRGEQVSFRPRGNSMSGKIESGQLCTVEPVDPSTLKVADIVLCKVNGREYLHLVKAIQGPRLQIGNNRGRINGWIGPAAVFGRCIRIER